MLACVPLCRKKTVASDPMLHRRLMADIGLLHGLGIRLVVVLSVHPQIRAALEERGSASVFIGGYRATCAVALMEAAVEAAGRSRTAVERYVSRGPSVHVFRRHSKCEGTLASTQRCEWEPYGSEAARDPRRCGLWVHRRGRWQQLGLGCQRELSAHQWLQQR